MSRFLIGLVRLYQVTLGGALGGQCRFEPSCSNYAIIALREKGAVHGTALALWRVVRCGPWSRGGVEYPPKAVNVRG